MLVLTRKTQQRIQIGSNITVTILQVKGQAVRVGIEAPHDVHVLRTELLEQPRTDISSMLAVKPQANCSVGNGTPVAEAGRGATRRSPDQAGLKTPCGAASGALGGPLSRHLRRVAPAPVQAGATQAAPFIQTSLQSVVGIGVTPLAYTVGC